VIFAAREYRDDVRMRQTGGKVGLAQEALLRALEGFGDDLGQAWQDLNRHPPLQRWLLGLVDHAHGAASQLMEHGEFAELHLPACHRLGEGRGGRVQRRSGFQFL
jgi:hypothetical protein